MCEQLHSGNDVEAMFSLADLLVAPPRGPLMPHWEECQQTARRAGARAGGISGSGPSSFWVCRSAEEAGDVAQALGGVMAHHGMAHNLHTTTISSQGAHVVS